MQNRKFGFFISGSANFWENAFLMKRVLPCIHFTILLICFSKNIIIGIDKSCVTQYNLFVMINTLQQKENNMKNRIVLLLVVTLLLLLSACNEGASDNASESIESQGLSRGESREETSEPTEVHQYFDWKDCSLFGMSDGTLKAHIKEWDKEYVVPSSFVAASDDKVNQNFDATFADDIVYITNIIETGDTLLTINTAKISKNSGEVVCGTDTTEVKCVYDVDGTKLSGFDGSIRAVSFYEEDHGAMFFTDNYATRHLVVLKTTDGGKTWERAGDDSNLAVGNWHEYPLISKFINDDEGMVGFTYYSDEDLCDRTFVTTDGGKTWKKISVDDENYSFGNHCAWEPRSLKVENGRYWLTVKKYGGGTSELNDIFTMVSDRIDSGYKFVDE